MTLPDDVKARYKKPPPPDLSDRERRYVGYDDDAADEDEGPICVPCDRK